MFEVSIYWSEHFNSHSSHKCSNLILHLYCTW